MLRAQKISLINKQLAQDTKELHRLIMSQTPLAKHKVTLSARYSTGEDPVEVIGKGDDGRVFKIGDTDGNTMAVKIIDKRPGRTFRTTRAFIAKDQAYREFKALNMIGTHPNFCKLYSKELDEFRVTTDEDDGSGQIIRTKRTAWAIRMSYEENLTRIADAQEVLGFNHEAGCVEARCASAVFMHILSQMAATLHKLRSLQIRHRDLDACNVMLKVPEMTLKIFDFSRADLPLDTSIKSPNEMMQPTYDLPVEQRNTEYSERRLEEATEQFRQQKQRELFQNAYIVPNTLNPNHNLGCEDEPSDFEALRMLIGSTFLLSTLMYMRLAERQSDYEEYDQRIWHFAIGEWRTVQDLPIIERKDYNSHLERAIILYESVLQEHKTLKNALEYLKTAPSLTLECDLADTSDPINAYWLSGKFQGKRDPVC
jgi:serine/threonine protein kinase